MPSIDTNISARLTPEEKELFGILINVVKEKTPHTSVRAAGGWVRDKLLGRNPDDIDFMIDNMSGEEFAKLVTEHMGLKDPHVIKENPDKSKHVETATANIPLSSGEVWKIDFARARDEVYEEDSRIPNIVPATPEEDAFRRDLTINSMFYNVNTGKLEDFTGKGIQDLISMTMRTPEEPLKTFSDDPLRIFRTIRFASRYNGEIDKDTLEALSDPKLIDDIKRKVSKERIGQEVKKMLSENNPVYALELLKNTGLWQHIVNDALKETEYTNGEENTFHPLDMEQNNPWHELTVWGHTMQVVSNLLEKYAEADSEKRVTIILAALMHDMGKLYSKIQADSKSHPGRTSYHGHEKESQKIAEHILRYLKLEPYIDQVGKIARYHMQPHGLSDDGVALSAVRKFIRRMGEQSLNWLDVFNFSVADATAKGLEIDPQVVSKYQELESRLQEALATLASEKNLMKIKPILNGKEIMDELGIKPGYWMTHITEFVKELKDENPNITKEEAKVMLRERYKDVKMEDLNKEACGGGEECTCGCQEDESKFSMCPQPLLKAKLKELNHLLVEGNDFQALSTLKLFKKDYGDDDKVSRLLSIIMFKLICRDKGLADQDVLRHIFEKAEKDFFDTILCGHVFGILTLIPTPTKKKAISKVGERIFNMSPGLLRSILDMVKRNAFHKDIVEHFENKLSSYENN